ncbi:uncharacterized protein LOC143357098 [Halictus rubicundus]|uniref:uncharacterized protein LOC143357098 n=1 Tax=Halictus rubicundus TaxID=77578 RepID=UPI0040350C12
METSRGHFVGAFVLFILMLSTTQAFPRNKEDSSKRNNVSDDADFKELECLFVDTKLPICDPKWWSNSSGEFIINRTINDAEPTIDKTRMLRKRSVVETAADTRVVVYAFKNCLFTEPARLRFLMPFCEDVMQPHHYDKIVRVELFEPFVIEGLKKPPYLFPSRPKRPSSNKRHRGAAEKDQGHELAKTTSTGTILNEIAGSMSVSSSSGLVPRSLAETMGKEEEVIAKSLGEEPRNFGAKFSDEHDRRHTIVIDRRKPCEEEDPSGAEAEDPLAILAIPKAPTTPGPSNVPKLTVGKLIAGNSANKPGNRRDSDDLLLGPGPQREENSNGGDPNDPLTSPEIIAKNLRRTRETKTTEASSH